MILLDSDTSIFFMKGNPAVSARYARQGPQTIFLSAISYYECHRSDNRTIGSDHYRTRFGTSAHAGYRKFAGVFDGAGAFRGGLDGNHARSLNRLLLLRFALA